MAHFENCQCGHGLAGFEGLQYQKGHGLTGFEGVRYQKGYGLWGTLFNFAKPILKFLGTKAMEWVGGVASDYVSGEPIKESVKKRLKQTALDITEKGGEEAQELTKRGITKAMKFIAQRGSGKKRRRKSVACVKIKKRRVTKKKRPVGRPRTRGRPRKYKRTSRKTSSFDFLQ